MIKINTTQKNIDDFYNSIIKLFEKKLIKKEKKKLKWEIELLDINNSTFAHKT